MGCGFVGVVPEADDAAAVELLARRHPGARGSARSPADAGRVAVPALGLAGGPDGLGA